MEQEDTREAQVEPDLKQSLKPRRSWRSSDQGGARDQQETHTEEPVEPDTRAAAEQETKVEPMELKGRDDNQGGAEEHR